MSNRRIEWLCHRAASIQINTGADSPPSQVERWGPTSGNPWNPVAATPREDKNQWGRPMIPYFLTLKIHRKTCLALRERKDWPWLHQTPCDVSIRVPPLSTVLLQVQFILRVSCVYYRQTGAMEMTLLLFTWQGPSANARLYAIITTSALLHFLFYKTWNSISKFLWGSLTWKWKSYFVFF